MQQYAELIKKYTETDKGVSSLPRIKRGVSQRVCKYCKKDLSPVCHPWSTGECAHPTLPTLCIYTHNYSHCVELSLGQVHAQKREETLDGDTVSLVVSFVRFEFSFTRTPNLQLLYFHVSNGAPMPNILAPALQLLEAS